MECVYGFTRGNLVIFAVLAKETLILENKVGKGIKNCRSLLVYNAKTHFTHVYRGGRGRERERLTQTG